MDLGPSLPTFTSQHTVTWTSYVTSRCFGGNKRTSPTGLHEDETNSYMLALSLQSLAGKLSCFISPSHFDLHEVGGVQILQLEKLEHK